MKMVSFIAKHRWARAQLIINNVQHRTYATDRIAWLGTNMDLISGFVLVLIAILTSIYVYFKYSYTYWKSRGIPYEEPSFPFGNIKGLGKTLHPGHFIKNLYDKYKPSGAKLCGVYFFANPNVVILDLDLVKSIMVKDFALFDSRGCWFSNQWV